MIADSILASIASGELRNGDRVTSERNLARQFEVSLGTVQRALQKLEQRGVLSREHGRGSFVRGLGASLDAHYVRFRDLAGKDLPLYWHVLRHNKSRPRKEVAAFFPAHTSLIRIDRKIDVAGMFVLFGQFFLPEESFESLPAGVTDDTNLRESISQALGVPVLRVEQSVGFGPMPADAARELNCSATGPCFQLELRSFTVDDRPVSLQKIYGEPFQNAVFVMDTKGGA